MHRGRRGRLSSLFLGDPLWEVPCGTRSESDLLERWVHRSTALGWVFARCKFHDGNWLPLGVWLGDGWGRWRWRAPLFPAKLSYVAWGSTILPPVVLQPSHCRAELLAYILPDVKSHLLWNTLRPALRLLPARLRASAWPAAAPPPRLPPTSPWSAHSLTALPTLFCGPLICAWLQRLHSANPLAVFWVI